MKIARTDFSESHDLSPNFSFQPATFCPNISERSFHWNFFWVAKHYLSFERSWWERCFAFRKIKTRILSPINLFCPIFSKSKSLRKRNIRRILGKYRKNIGRISLADILRIQIVSGSGIDVSLTTAVARVQSICVSR